MIYWPGTNIPKSQGNAFTSWKRENKKIESVIKQLRDGGYSLKKSDLEKKKSFTIYTKA